MRKLAIVVGLALSGAALAQFGPGVGTQPGYSVPRGTDPDRPPLNEAGRSFRGEVKGLDKVSGTVTLRHGPIDALFVRAGTSEYQVKESAQLERLKVGDEVRFSAVLQGRSILVTNIAPEK